MRMVGSVIEEGKLFGEFLVVLMEEFLCDFAIDAVGAVVLDAVVVDEVDVLGEVILGLVAVVEQFGLHCGVVHRLLDQRRVVQQFQLLPLHRLVERYRVLPLQQHGQDLVARLEYVVRWCLRLL